jgi:hypothetical protein
MGGGGNQAGTHCLVAGLIANSPALMGGASGGVVDTRLLTKEPRMKYPTAGGEYVAPKEPKPATEKPQESESQSIVRKRPAPSTPDTPDTTADKD